MKTLLVVLGILATFGVLFWLDWYYKNTDTEKEGGYAEPSGSDGDDSESQSDSI